jgi:peptide/nickel transport system ATP-binding protein
MAQALLQVSDLTTHLNTSRGVVQAVDGVSFDVNEGEVMGLVGESGSGKTMTAMSIARMLPQPAGRIVRGSVKLAGEELVDKTQAQMQDIRGRLIGTILQDPMSSLNPVFSIGNQIGDAIMAHRDLPRGSVREEVKRLLDLVRIPAAKSRVDDYPHQMSGGMRQRVVGALALSCTPKLLIADEPTTALDVTVQAQYLNLLRELQRELSLSIVMITHDFGVVAAVCDKVAVMYAGRIVEQAPVGELFDRPQHPYSVALLGALRTGSSGRKSRLFSLAGQPPDLRDPGKGCRFAPRCAHAMDRCREQYPPATLHGVNHVSNCWLHQS